VTVPTVALDSEGSTDDLTGMAATVAKGILNGFHRSLAGEFRGRRGAAGPSHWALGRPRYRRLMRPIMPLRTNRLVLRRWRDSDRDAFAQLNAHPEVMEHFLAPLARAESDAMIDKIEAHFDERGFGLWAVEVAKTGEFIGFTGLSTPRFPAHFMPAVEIGWRLARSVWGQGYASEAARRALACGFEDVGLPEIVSFTAVGNLRSQAVMARIGMTHDQLDDFEHPLVPEGSPLRRHVLYRLTSQRWLARS
jgi:RimJ/RimL family protein N-acetyltransferase